METNEIKDRIKNLSWKKPYRPYSISKNIIEKTFNRGMGSLALFKFDFEHKTIKINSALYNKADEKKLNKLIKDCGIEDWKQAREDYGYPSYYSHSF